MKFSIVTPSYRQAEFIERTLTSVATQGMRSLEHVVFDGGSDDGTVEVLKRWSDKVRWHSGSDDGQADAVNKALLATDGDIVGWLNSDDVYYPGALGHVEALFRENSDVDVVYGAADHIDVMDRAFESYPTEPWDFERLKQTCFICQPALFFRRRVIERVGLLNSSLHFCMDYEYWLRLGRDGARFLYTDMKLAGSRLYAENKTLAQRVKVHREINEMLKDLFGSVPDAWLYNYAHAVTERKVNRLESPGRFAVEVGVRSLLAALRWNRSVSAEMRREVGTWIAG